MIKDNKITKEEKKIVGGLNIGRPTKLTKDVVSKLEYAFAVGATVSEACYWADISRDTYYKWCKTFLTLSDRFDNVRQRLPLKAKQNIATSIENGDVSNSWRYIERQQPEGYAETLNMKHSGAISNEQRPEDQAAIDIFTKTLRENRIKRSMERAKADGEIQ